MLIEYCSKKETDERVWTLPNVFGSYENCRFFWGDLPHDQKFKKLRGPFSKIQETFCMRNKKLLSLKGDKKLFLYVRHHSLSPSLSLSACLSSCVFHSSLRRLVFYLMVRFTKKKLGISPGVLFWGSPKMVTPQDFSNPLRYFSTIFSKNPI